MKEALDVSPPSFLIVFVFLEQIYYHEKKHSLSDAENFSLGMNSFQSLCMSRSEIMVPL